MGQLDEAPVWQTPENLQASFGPISHILNTFQNQYPHLTDEKSEAQWDEVTYIWLINDLHSRTRNTDLPFWLIHLSLASGPGNQSTDDRSVGSGTVTNAVYKVNTPIHCFFQTSLLYLLPGAGLHYLNEALTPCKSTGCHLGHLLLFYTNLIWAAGVVVTVLPIPVQSAMLPYLMGASWVMPWGSLESA